MSTRIDNPDRQVGAGVAAAPYEALFTDLYELTMLQTYFAQGMEDQAVFSLFVRRLPERRNSLLACGLDTVLDYLEHLRFTADDIAYLRSLGQFSGAFLDRLKDFRFSGEVHAVPEGTPVFANGPILEIVAPLAEAQLVETLVPVHDHTLRGAVRFRSPIEIDRSGEHKPGLGDISKPPCSCQVSGPNGGQLTASPVKQRNNRWWSSRSLSWRSGRTEWNPRSSARTSFSGRQIGA